MEKLLTNSDVFKDVIVSGWEYKQSREAVIYHKDKVVYKIFNDYVSEERRNEKNIDKLEVLNPMYITKPNIKVYFDNVYQGFGMDYGGITLLEFLKKFRMNQRIVEVFSRQMKNITLYLEGFGITHGDIGLSNIVYKDGIIRLTDVNNMIFPDDQENHANLLYKDWYKATGTFKFLDEYACNLICFLLLNYPTEFLINIFSRDFYFDNNFLKDLLNIKCDMFDQEVLQVVKASILGDRDAIKQLKPNTFLIDYLR